MRLRMVDCQLPIILRKEYFTLIHPEFGNMQVDLEDFDSALEKALFGALCIGNLA